MGAGSDPKQGPVQQVGAVAERLGLSVRTLHHWDEAGLVRPSARSAGGFRLYTESDVDRLITVRRMKPLGFTLDEMRTLLTALDTLADHPADPSARATVRDFTDRAEESHRQLSQKLAWATEFRDLLDRLGR